MDDRIKTEWARFTNWHKDSFNPPAGEAIISKTEAALGFAIPEGLKDVYRLSNGQLKMKATGVFKNVSGADVYTHVRFLSVEELPRAWNMIISDKEISEEFNNEFLPFALEKEKTLGYCFGISLKTGGIYMLWTDCTDYFTPVSWQLWRIFRANSMLEFIQLQNLMFF